jgi:hypothetical protein
MQIVTFAMDSPFRPAVRSLDYSPIRSGETAVYVERLTSGSEEFRRLT